MFEERQKLLVNKGESIYPCRLKIYKQYVYMKGGADDIMLGVKSKRREGENWNANKLFCIL